MTKRDFDVMGDRHKLFESREAAQRLMPGLPFIIRLDGRAFHTFTRGLARPYDERLSRAMIETTKFLVAETNASIGYTQSDEISLAFPNTDPAVKIMYDGRIQKIASIHASLASVKFNRLMQAKIPEKAHLTPVFDARVWAYPNLELAAEHFMWREWDATRNSLTMAAHAYYSQKELHKAGFRQKHDMLFEKGVNWNDYPAFFKRGTYVRRESVSKVFTDAELARIPEARRPSGPILRSEIREVDLLPLRQVANLHGVLFRGEKPEERAPLEVLAA